MLLGGVLVCFSALAELGSGAPAQPADRSAARANAPEQAAGARSAAPAFRGLVRRAARLPEEVEEEEVSAAMAAARACRVRSWRFAGESREPSPTMGGVREMMPKIK